MTTPLIIDALTQELEQTKELLAHFKSRLKEEQDVAYKETHKAMRCQDALTKAREYIINSRVAINKSGPIADDIGILNIIDKALAEASNPSPNASAKASAPNPSFQFSDEWCRKAAELEGDQPFAAGYMEASAPPKVEYPWHEAPKWAKFAATDENCLRFWFEKEPVDCITCWGIPRKGEFTEIVSLPCPHWRETKQQRPGAK